jgi:ubiquinone/menaquinone biosynthesis C-methylase UbiE
MTLDRFLIDPASAWDGPGLARAVPGRRTGCRVVLTDLPLAGLRVAADRAASEALAARTGVVAAAASGLPFRAGSFDVIIHTDVLC